MADAFQVLAEPRRREVLMLVSERERTAGEIAGRFDVTRQAVSQHLRILLEAGLVNERREGARRWYSARPEGLEDVRTYLEAMWPRRWRGSRWPRSASTRRERAMPGATEPLRHELQIAAPPEVVFAYFTDPARMVEWMGVGALLDPRPGGALRIDANGRDVVVGEYVELDPPRRLVFTWGFDGDERATAAGFSRVEVVLEPHHGDRTRLTLSHHDLPPSARPSHEQGWNHYLERLGRAAAGDPPGRDPWLATT